MRREKKNNSTHKARTTRKRYKKKKRQWTAWEGVIGKRVWVTRGKTNYASP